MPPGAGFIQAKPNWERGLRLALSMVFQEEFTSSRMIRQHFTYSWVNFNPFRIHTSLSHDLYDLSTDNLKTDILRFEHQGRPLDSDQVPGHFPVIAILAFD